MRRCLITNRMGMKNHRKVGNITIQHRHPRTSIDRKHLKITSSFFKSYPCQSTKWPSVLLRWLLSLGGHKLNLWWLMWRVVALRPLDLRIVMSIHWTYPEKCVHREKGLFVRRHHCFEISLVVQKSYKLNWFRKKEERGEI